MGEAGAELSGGQRQKLACARAVLRKSRLYVFDEATSNIDAESEADILSVISHLATLSTVIVITHRLSAVQLDADVVVLSDGRIAERGRPESLLAHDGAFRRLHTDEEFQYVSAR